MSNGLGQLDIFFQGQKVAVQGIASKSIQLEENPTP